MPYDAADASAAPTPSRQTRTHDPATLRHHLDRFASRTVAIVGDVMLDHFVVGRVQRISPEAPVPVVEHLRDEFRAGGAANVAANVAALGARAILVGVVGADEAGQHLQKILGGFAATLQLVTDDARPTTRKVRIVTQRHQQVARIDYEQDAEVAGAIEDSVIAASARAAARADVVILSDYLKGCISQRLVKELTNRRREGGPMVLVDPKIPHLAYYEGATLVTPNHHEAEVATHRRIRDDAEAAVAARDFRARARCQSVLVTRGEHGMWLVEGEPPAPHQPVHETPARREAALPARAREVADVTGAGDTVIATLAVALAAGAGLPEAAELANHAAGIAVGKFGPVAVSLDELRMALEAT